MQPFAFDRVKGERSILDSDGALWPVNVYSDADELDRLVQAAIDSRVLARRDQRTCLYVYPLSLSEPDPLLAVDLGVGPILLGHALNFREREGESTVEFTLGLLEEMTAEANGLAKSGASPRLGAGADEPDRHPS